MKPDKTRNTRAARYRAATKADGGTQVNVRVGPGAAAVLAKMRETMSMREAIESAILCQATRHSELFWDEMRRAIINASQPS